MTAPDDFESLAERRVTSLSTASEPLDLDTFAAMFDLFRVSARVTAELEASVHRPLGLSIAGFRVLFTIWVFETLEPRQIARFAGVSTAAVSGVVSTLARDGLVTKSRRADDRRRVDVTLTAAGEERVAQAYREQNRRERDLFAAVDRDELRAFTATLRRLLALRD